MRVFALLLPVLFFGCRTPVPAPSDAPYLLVLGIAQDAGFPQAGCRKDCCRPLWSDLSARRRVTALGLVDPVSGERWLFEATPDLPDQLSVLAQAEPPATEMRPDGVFLTHAHIGHYTGLMHLGREAMGAPSVPVFAMPRMTRFLTENGPWSQLVSLQNIALQPLVADSAIVLNERLTVTPFLVPHRDEFSETVGFLIEGPQRKALFIPDIDKWDRWERDILAQVRQVDLALLDGTFFRNGEIPNRDMSEIPHPFIEESLSLFSALDEPDRAKVHFIHFNHTNPAIAGDEGAVGVVQEAGCRIAEEGWLFPF